MLQESIGLYFARRLLILCIVGLVLFVGLPIGGFLLGHYVWPDTSAVSCSVPSSTCSESLSKCDLSMVRCDLSMLKCMRDIMKLRTEREACRSLLDDVWRSTPNYSVEE